MVGIKIGREKVLRQVLNKRSVLVIGAQLVRPKATLIVKVTGKAFHEGIRAIKASGRRQEIGLVAQMPLAQKVRIIIALTQQIRKRHHIAAQVRLVSRYSYLIRGLMHRSAGVSIVCSSQNRRSCGTANGLIVKVSQYQASFGQLIQMGRVDLPAIYSQIGVS